MLIPLLKSLSPKSSVEKDLIMKADEGMNGTVLAVEVSSEYLLADYP